MTTLLTQFFIGILIAFCGWQLIEIRTLLLKILITQIEEQKK